MTRKARCLCEKDFLEKSLSPTKYCSLKYSKLRLRQAMAPADRQKGRPILYPEWVALLVPIPQEGRILPAHPFTSLGMSHALARALSQFYYHSTSATSLVSAEEQCKNHTFPERQLLGWKKNVYVCGFMTLETANLLDHSLAKGVRRQ